jgi:hypothetical protein
MGNIESNVGDASVAAPRVENLGPLLESQQLQTSIQDKKQVQQEPKTGFLDLSGDVYGGKKNSESTSQSHRITPEEQRQIEIDKQAIARKMEQHEFTPEELANQAKKQQMFEANGGKLQIIGGPDSPGARLQEQKDGKTDKTEGDKKTKIADADATKLADAKPVDAKPVEGKKPFDPDTKGDGKSTKDGKLGEKGEPSDQKLTPEQIKKIEAMKAAGIKGEPAEKLTDAQWEKLRQMKLDAEAHAHGNKGKPVDDNGNEKPKPTAGNKPDGKPDGKPHETSGDVTPIKPWNIDPGHSKPKVPTEKPPVPKQGG